MGKKLNPAVSFFQNAVVQEEVSKPKETAKITEQKQTETEPMVKEQVSEPKKNKPKAKPKKPQGRPRKNAERQIQCTITINPVLLEKAKMVAEDRCGGNFSRLMSDSFKLYCQTHGIDLDTIDVGERNE